MTTQFSQLKIKPPAARCTNKLGPFRYIDGNTDDWNYANSYHVYRDDMRDLVKGHHYGRHASTIRNGCHYNPPTSEESPR